MTDAPWYSHAVIYQIYPRSFADANGDGVGDLVGITRHLDYLSELGVDALWLSPIYQSPMIDFGYDVSDYQAVDQVFGSLEDFDQLVAEAHARGLKLIMDFVPNHTSDQHPWFQASRASRDNPKRDWYVWKDPRLGGSPPNNWLAMFGGSAWTLDPATGQYYLHSFLEQQPDLNWSNPEVRYAIHDILRFWFGRGVDGFRVDAINFLSKDPDHRDNPKNALYQPDIDDPAKEFDAKFSMDGPDLKRWLHELAAVAKEFSDSCLFFEVNPHIRKFDPLEYARYYQLCDTSVSAPFNFGLIFTPWEAGAFQRYINTFQPALPKDSIATYVLGNHDRRRLASRVGEDAARTAAVLLLTLPGTQFLYYGDELGMQDTVVNTADVHDPFGKQVPGFSRDPQRTPMQWSAETYAGFSSRRPWLPVNDDYETRNVVALRKDDKSLLALYRQLIALKKDCPALRVGSYSPGKTPHAGIVCFERIYDTQKISVFLNFSDASVTLPGSKPGGKLLLSSLLDRQVQPIDTTTLSLRPYEAWIVEYMT